MNTEFDSPDWSLIKSRPSGGKVLFNEGLGLYAKQGSNSLETALEYEGSISIASMGFPVPTTHMTESSSYFTEDTLLGNHMLNDLSTLDKSAMLGKYKLVLSEFARAQINNPVDKIDISAIKKNIFLENVLEENPDLAKEFNLETLLDDMFTILPKKGGYTAHGDLSPANIFEDGIIDWEFRFNGCILGYDLLALQHSGILHGSSSTSLFEEDSYNIFVSESLNLGNEEIVGLRGVSLLMKSLFYVSHMVEDVKARPHKEPVWRRRRGVIATIAKAVLDNQDISESTLIASTPR